MYRLLMNEDESDSKTKTAEPKKKPVKVKFGGLVRAV